jgi:hypothetical protein
MTCPIIHVKLSLTSEIRRIMKSSDESPYFHGFHGKFGGMVFIQRNGKTIVSALPQKSTNPLSENQIMAQNRFRRASEYAKTQIGNPETRAVLAQRLKPGQSAYTLAMSDFFKSNALK